MKSIGILFVILVLIAAAAAITKPDKESFQTYIQNQEGKGKDGLEQLLDFAGNMQESLMFEYEDYILFAKISSLRGVDKIEYLGIFSLWLPMKALPIKKITK